jgi:parallel beta-helix repeat protein
MKRHGAWIALLSFLLASGTRAESPSEALLFLAGDGGSAGFTCTSVQAADCQSVANWDELEAAIARYASRGTTSSGARLVSLQVLLGPGVHRVDHALRIEGWGNTPNTPKLIIQGDPKGSIVLGSLMVPKEKWEAAPQGTTQNPSAAQHTRLINYAKITGRRTTTLAVREAFGQELHPLPLDLFQGEDRMTLAHWPNAGYGTIKQVSPSEGARTAVQLNGQGFQGVPADGALISGYLANDWGYERLPIKPDPAGAGTVSVANGDVSLGIKAGQRVIIENSLAELDSPGEWYFDEGTQDIYFWPRDTGQPESNQIEIAISDLFLSISNSHNIRINGLTFRNGLGDAIDIDRSSDISFDHLTVENVANLAVRVKGGENLAIRNCHIQNVGGGGIYIYGGDRNTLRPGRNSVDHCVIEKFAQRIKTYQPAIRLEGVGNSAVSNYIRESPHAGIIFNGNDELIDSNHIANVVTEGDDSGAIYTGRDWTARGSIVRNNMVANIKGRNGAHQAVGLYLDDQASGVLVDKNIFVNVMFGVLLGGGSDNIVQDNIFVGNHSAIVVDARGVTWQAKETQDHAGTLWTNLTRIPVDSAPYKKYPHLADLKRQGPGTPRYDEFHGNVFVGSGGFEVRDPGYFAWKDSENIARGEDSLARRGSESSPDYYELIRSALPAAWPVQ